jgi:MoaA/NifB/PqqE/SkfB family radical SAM enzyme
MALILDNSKILWHQERLNRWQEGKKIYPITIDMALTQACGYNCIFCYSKNFQTNTRFRITWEIAKNFLDDCAEMKVKDISLVSDGESTLNPIWTDFILYAKKLNIDVALGSCGYFMNHDDIEKVLAELTYLRFNISAGTPERYSFIHGVPIEYFNKVCDNIAKAVEFKRKNNLKTTIGLQMVLMPQYSEDIIPLSKLAVDLKADYLIIKHCSDDENNSLGIDYGKYKELDSLLKEAESLSTDQTSIFIKWNKLREGNIRSYKKCYGPPFHLQISGSGLVAPCGMLFGEKYKKYHIDRFTEKRFKDIVDSEKYWQIMKELASDKFNAQTMCGCLCLQHHTNKVLDKIMKGQMQCENSFEDMPQHCNFI